MPYNGFRTPRVLTAGSDFSGLETGAHALKKLGVPHKLMFSCDNSKASKRFIMHHFKPKVFYEDVKGRDIEKMPKVDLFFYTAPCVDFSTNGKMRGATTSRGRLLKHSLRYIK